MLSENILTSNHANFVLRCFKTNVIAIVIVITFNVIDYIVILFIRNRHRTGG